MPVTTINALRVPDGAGAASIALYFQQLAADLDTKLNPVFATAAARDAAIPSPTGGMKCVTAGRDMLYRSGAWAKQGGIKEIALESGDAGTFGAVNVGAGQVTVLTLNVPATGVAADTGHAHVVVGLKSSGTTVGNVQVVVNGVATTGQIFNLDSGAAVPVPVDMPVSIPATAFQVVVRVAATLGSSCSMSYSAVRLTF